MLSPSSFLQRRRCLQRHRSIDQAEYFFSRERYAADMFLFVDQDLRRCLMSGVIAEWLWEQFRDWAQVLGLRENRNGVATGIAIEGAHRFFSRLGM